MKKLLLVVALLLSVNAFATKARVAALGYADHLTDEQYLFAHSPYVNYLENFISLETGVTAVGAATTRTSNAEGMVSYGLSENSRVIVSLGTQDLAVTSTRTFMNGLGTTHTMSQNPIHIFYGNKSDNMNYAFGILYSNFDDKVTGNTESSAAINFGVEMGPWQYYGTYTLVNNVETAGVEFDGAGYIAANVYYTSEAFHSFLYFNKATAKSATAGTENESHSLQNITLGILSTTAKDGNDVFWGSRLVLSKVECKVTGSAACDQSFSSTSLPVFVGFEAQANSWLTLRGSVTQSVLVNQSKDDVGYPTAALAAATGAVSDFAAGPNNSAVAAGVGLKFGTATIDASLAAATTQTLNFASALAQLGVKYNF